MNRFLFGIIALMKAIILILKQTKNKTFVHKNVILNPMKKAQQI